MTTIPPGPTEPDYMYEEGKYTILISTSLMFLVILTPIIVGCTNSWNEANAEPIQNSTWVYVSNYGGYPHYYEAWKEEGPLWEFTRRRAISELEYLRAKGLR